MVIVLDHDRFVRDYVLCTQTHNDNLWHSHVNSNDTVTPRT